MDGESEKLLKETYKLAKENNKMLHRIRKAQKLASFLRSIYWVLIIGLGIGAYYFVQPIFAQMLDFIQSTGDSITNLKDSIPF